MSAISKLLIIIGLNFSALVFLIYRLVKEGNSYRTALGITWDWIMVQTGTNLTGNPKPPMVAALLLGKFWWLMLLSFGITWVNSKELAFLPVVIFLVLIHGYWFLEGYAGQNEQFEKVLNLNENWGIIYKEIVNRSGVNGKTLAELDLRKKNLLVLAIERQGRLTPFPKGLEVLAGGDRMVMFGDLYSFHSIFENGNDLKEIIPE
ncbi:MAG: cation:proton antiporter regulatory subunit [Bacteroidota bacterium]